MSWMLMFGLFLGIFPTAIVLLWLLHQKGLFDPLYDWWEDHVWTSDERRGEIWKYDKDADLSLIQFKKNHRHHKKSHKNDAQKRQSVHSDHRLNHLAGDTDYHYYLHHVHKNKHKHRRHKHLGIPHIQFSRGEDDIEGARYHRRRKERKSPTGFTKHMREKDEDAKEYLKHDNEHYTLNTKRRE